MTAVPLPDTPCVRVRITGIDDVGNDWGTRFYLSYSGSAPSGANCNTLASDISSAFGTNLAGLLYSGSETKEVDVIDIASTMGASGSYTTAVAGTRSGNILPIQCAFNCEYGIAERYRGGKPRGYWPFGVDGDLQDQANWSSSFVTTVGTDIAAFFAAIEALSVGSMGTLQHVLLSYYHGFTNHTNTSGRTKPVPTYRATALHFNVESYIPKKLLGSQRRRRSATSP